MVAAVPPSSPGVYVRWWRRCETNICALLFVLFLSSLTRWCQLPLCSRHIFVLVWDWSDGVACAVLRLPSTGVTLEDWCDGVMPPGETFQYRTEHEAQGR
ncbi:unnamed protein product [Knipowitschia caucasica]